MRKLILFVLILCAATLFGEDQKAPGVVGSSSQLSLQLSPAVGIPVGPSGSVFSVGGSVLAGAQFKLPSQRWFLSGAFDYDYHGATGGTKLSVSSVALSVGAGIGFPLAPWATLQGGLSTGYFYSFLSDSSASGGNPFISVGAGMLFLPGPLHFSLGTSFDYYFGLYSGMKASVGISYDVIGAAKSVTPPKTEEKPVEKPQPLKVEPPKEKPVEKPAPVVELKDVAFDDIYPVFRTYYATHPLGKVVLRNGLDKPISGIKVRFQIKEFMTDPTDCPAPTDLGPGESKSVDLLGLFLPSILETTEKTKAQATIDVTYTLNGQPQHLSAVQAIPILDRNATTWADNRRAAAFVTTKDPSVLLFSKNVNSMVKGKTKGAINPNLLTAIAFFQALQLYGLTYSQDPVPTYTANNQVADYIQFPRQTLQYKGGKCSDFSVLYSALLESAGIETAFITTPGHIFMAFSTGLGADDARKTFSRPDELIIRAGNDKSWIPVEVTESAGFLKAWQDGAREWRENLSKQQADFYPIHDAWTLYESVGLSGAEVALNLPPSDTVVDSYVKEAGKFVDQEIFSRVASLQNQIDKSPDPRKPRNSLGVLYARYGQYDKAQQEFDKLLAKGEYVPALLNMGNIFYINDQKEKALEYYNRAYAKDPDNADVLLAVAKVNHDLENYYQVKKMYTALKSKDPDLAEKFAYLDLKGEEATRAAEIRGVSGVIIWEE
ncbi:MAG: tetratricopeptide repeat protein [Spirochaetia bacterium]|jgi:tetratricopeptide (TPR) repeat protein